MEEESWQRPARPNLIWFSTGFWQLERQNQRDCEERFQLALQAIQHWRSLGIRVVWQSLFSINQHDKITNAQIDWDYHCQKLLTSQNAIEMVDIYRTIQLMGVRKVVNTYHLNAGNYERIVVQPLLDLCCGGWEQYYGRVRKDSNQDNEILEREATMFGGKCQKLAEKGQQRLAGILSTTGKTSACCDDMWRCMQEQQVIVRMRRHYWN